MKCLLPDIICGEVGGREVHRETTLMENLDGWKQPHRLSFLKDEGSSPQIWQLRTATDVIINFCEGKEREVTG